MGIAPCPVVTAFSWVPDFARGLVRDLRIRWALEELGEAYDIEKFGAAGPRPEGYVNWQPFEQVPAFRDGDLELFETGAILLYLTEKQGALLPTDEQARWRAIAWLFAALNSVEPVLMRLASYRLFLADKEWAPAATEATMPLARQKLKRVAQALGDQEWLAGEFSIADIMMSTVLDNAVGAGLVAEQPTLAAYHDRARARPAYQRALAAQLADFEDQPTTAA
jgi:glutathione S-transferase